MRQIMLDVIYALEKKIEVIANEIKEMVKSDLDLFEKQKCKPEHKLLLTTVSACKLYYIDKGIARTYTHDMNGEDVTVRFTFPGGLIIPYISFIEKLPPLFNVEIIRNSLSNIANVYSVDYNNWQILLQRHPNLHNMLEKHAIYTLYKNYCKHVHNNGCNAKKVYEKMLRENDPVVTSGIPLKYLASYFNISREHLSDMRGKISKGL